MWYVSTLRQRTDFYSPNFSFCVTPSVLYPSAGMIMSLLRLHNAREVPSELGTVPWIPKPVNKTKAGMLNELWATAISLTTIFDLPLNGALSPPNPRPSSSRKPTVEDWMWVCHYSRTPACNWGGRKQLLIALTSKWPFRTNKIYLNVIK